MSNSELTTTIILMAVVRILTFMLVVPIHESAHGLVAHWFGDDTAKEAGRISLNPFAHLDIAGFVIMLFLGVGWAKPVPVNPSKFKKRRLGMAMVALAGPVSNLIAAFIAAALCMVIACAARTSNIGALTIAEGMSAAEIAAMFLYMFAGINVSLAVFNLIPLPPLDGFNIIRSFMPAKFDIWVFKNFRAINTAFIVLLVLSTRVPVLLVPYYTVRNIVEELLWASVMWVPKLFGM